MTSVTVRIALACTMLLTGAIGVAAFVCVPVATGLVFATGGSALSGGERGGTYYVVGHGEEYAVSSTTFHAMRWAERLAITTVISFFIGCLACWLANRLLLRR